MPKHRNRGRDPNEWFWYGVAALAAAAALFAWLNWPR